MEICGPLTKSTSLVLRKGSDHFEPVEVRNHAVSQFAQTRDGTLWISDAWHEVRPLYEDQNHAETVRIPGVPLLLADDTDSLWLAHDFGGVTRIRMRGAKAEAENYRASDGLTDGQTRAILKDRQGTIWVGTARGLDRFQPSPLAQFHGVRIDYYPAIVAAKNGGIWIDDMDKPLMRLTSGKLSFLGKAHGSSSLYQTVDGAIWLHDPITHNFFRYSEAGAAPTVVPVPEIARDVENWCFGEDARGALLACFEGHGLWRYSGSWEKLKFPGLPAESPLSLVRGEEGRVWLGYPHNQIALDKGDGIKIFGASDGLELNSVLTFYESAGMLLAGGSEGLASFDGHRFHTLHLRTPGIMRNISGILEDRDGNLWLNGGAGVIRLPREEWRAALNDPARAMDFQLLNERDGLFGSPAQSKPAPSAVRDTDGKLWFATSGHLFSIDPAQVKAEQASLNVLLQNVLVNGSVVRAEPGAPIVVDGRHLQHLEFDYIAVDLKSPSRVTYQYLLEGQDKDWEDVGGRRQAFFTNLPPGNYRFRVRAASGTGEWSEMQSAMPLTVSPAFYQTRWFPLLCAAFVGLLAYLAYQWRVHQLAMRLDAQFEAQLAERTRIAQELHDTLLQGVLSASMQLNVANDQLSAESPAKPLVSRVLDLLGNVIDDGRNAVRGLRVSRDGAQDLEQAFARIPRELAVKSAAEFRLVVEGEPRPLHPIIRDEVYRIGREAITNAFRHSEATTIEVSVQRAADELRVIVRDNGIGIDQPVLRAGREGHWGLPGMRERAEKIGSKLKVWSSTAGTEVELRVPGRIAFESQPALRSSKWWTIFTGDSEAKSQIQKRA